MSSHILSEVERTCQRVAVIRSGKLVAIEEIERLRERAGQVVIVEFADSVAEDELSAIPGVQEVERQKHGAYHLKLAGTIDPMVKALARHTIRRLAIEEAPLEDVFLRFYAKTASDDTAGSPQSAHDSQEAGAAPSTPTTEGQRP